MHKLLPILALLLVVSNPAFAKRRGVKGLRRVQEQSDPLPKKKEEEAKKKDPKKEDDMIVTADGVTYKIDHKKQCKKIHKEKDGRNLQKVVDLGAFPPASPPDTAPELQGDALPSKPEAPDAVPPPPKKDEPTVQEDAADPLPPKPQVDGKPAKKDDTDEPVKADSVEDYPWCPLPNLKTKKLSAEACEALSAGAYPSDRRVQGSVHFEANYLDNDGADPVALMQDTLTRDTALKASGCSARRWLQQEEEGPETLSEISISGVKFSDLRKSDDVCASSGSSDDCDTLSASVDIFYTGDRDATEEEAADMMAHVSTTLQNQQFDDVQITNIDPVVETTSQDGQPPVGAIAGGTAAAAVIAAGAVAFKKYGKAIRAKWS